MTPRSIVGLRLLAGLLPLAMIAAEYDVSKGVKIEVTADAEQPEMMLGEPGCVKFKVANLSDSNLLIMVGGDYRNQLGRPNSFKVTVVDADGNKVAQPSSGWDMGGMFGPQKIPAKSEYVFKLFLQDWAAFEKPGRYTIALRRNVSLLPDNGTDAFKRKPKVIDATASTTLTIVPADAARMGKVIETLGTQAVSENSEPAMKQLRAIHDERVIPYYIALSQKVHASQRYSACAALKQYKNEESFQTLVRLTKTTGLEMRESATTLELAESSAAGVRRAAIHAIGDSVHPKALALFWTYADDPNYATRLTVLHKAAKVKSPEARAIIEKMATDENEQVRAEAMRYQKLLADEDARPAAEQAPPNPISANSVSLPQEADDDDLAQLKDKKQITKLVLNGMHSELAGPYITDAGLAHLEPMTQLKELWLDGIPFTDAGVAHLRGLTNLKVLRFFNAPITDVGLANLKDMKDLEDLQLGRSKITDKSLPIIGGMKKLKTLDLRANVTDEGMVHLEGLSELTWLCLNGTAVGDEGLVSVGKLDNLEWLMLEHTKITNAGLRHLKGLSKLKTLYLSQTKVGDESMQVAGELKSLVRLTLEKTQVSDAGLLQLKGLKKLETLEVFQTKVTDAGIAKLKESLPNLQVITYWNGD